MTPEEHARIKEVFLAACARPAGERMAFILQACGEDAGLRAAVEQLLAQHSEPPAGAATATQAAATRAASPTPATAAAPAGDRGDRGFAPGTIVAERYRIVSLLGRGGMGEVYRADDLTLDQAVALKFLPVELAQEPAWLARMRQEVRLAREITHPNVCRIHDFGVAGGDAYISMEYVDGEDLRTLLKRIGRVPADKGLEIARQLCAGLAAAHAKGVLHRDLKPANIMLDGAGCARIMDFGLAALPGALRAEDIRSGTPAYMAPEQLAGREVTERSDIYALGLVLYEVLTGKTPFPATSRRPLARRAEETPTPASSYVRDLDPRVEQTILQCLDADPARRPASALAVLAQLPGGDALTAAQAAGTVPSPSLVAASAAGHLSRVRRIAVLVGGCALLLIMALLTSQAHPVVSARADKPPDVLAERARDVLASLNWPKAAAAEAWGFRDDLSVELQPEAGAEPHAGALLNEPAGRGLLFWYRRSASPLVASDPLNLVLGAGRASPRDPPNDEPGRVRVVLDCFGRLRALEGVPPRLRDTPGSLTMANPLLTAAELDPAKLTPATPWLAPRVPFDKRWAWSAPAGPASAALRVELAGLQGEPVAFALLDESRQAEHAAESAEAARRERRLWWCEAGLTLAVLPVALYLAQRHRKRGVADPGGAARLAAVAFGLSVLSDLFQIPHSSSPRVEAGLVVASISGGLLQAALVWLLYTALEPFVRRFWPQTELAWARVLTGRWRDPLVGRDLLLGAALGIGWALLVRISDVGPAWFGVAGRPPVRPDYFFLNLLGVRPTIGFMLSALRWAIYEGLVALMLLVILRSLLRRTWLAAVVSTLLLSPLGVVGRPQPLAALVLVGLLMIGSLNWALMRFGLLAVVTGAFTAVVLVRVPLTLHLQMWYADIGLLGAAVALAILAGGYLVARRAELPAQAAR